MTVVQYHQDYNTVADHPDLFSPTFPNLHLFSPVVLTDLTLHWELAIKNTKEIWTIIKGRSLILASIFFLNSFHQKFLAGILNLGSKGILWKYAGSRQDRGLERGEMALFDKISTKCIAALQWIGPQFERGTSVFNIKYSWLFPRSVRTYPIWRRSWVRWLFPSRVRCRQFIILRFYYDEFLLDFYILSNTCARWFPKKCGQLICFFLFLIFRLLSKVIGFGLTAVYVTSPKKREWCDFFFSLLFGGFYLGFYCLD